MEAECQKDGKGPGSSPKDRFPAGVNQGVGRMVTNFAPTHPCACPLCVACHRARQRSHRLARGVAGASESRAATACMHEADCQSSTALRRGEQQARSSAAGCSSYRKVQQLQ